MLKVNSENSFKICLSCLKNILPLAFSLLLVYGFIAKLALLANNALNTCLQIHEGEIKIRLRKNEFCLHKFSFSNVI